MIKDTPWAFYDVSCSELLSETQEWKLLNDSLGRYQSNFLLQDDWGGKLESNTLRPL